MTKKNHKSGLTKKFMNLVTEEVKTRREWIHEFEKLKKQGNLLELWYGLGGDCDLPNEENWDDQLMEVRPTQGLEEKIQWGAWVEV